MTARRDLDRMITTWFDESAGAGAPDYLGETLDGIARVSQRPAWTRPERWLPMQMTLSRAQVPRALPVLAVVGLLVTAILFAAILAAGGRRLPPPVGLAGNGGIAYISDGQVWLAAPDGSLAHALTPPIPGTPSQQGAPVFSRDGTRIAYLDFAASIPSLVIADSDGAHAVTIATGAEMLRFIAWSPDGSRIFFSQWVGDVAGQRDRILVAPSDGSAPAKRIGDPGLSAFYPDVSPAGTRVAFISDHCQPGDCPTETNTYGLHVMDTDGSHVIGLASGAIHPWLDGETAGRLLDWSPDGGTILFTGQDLNDPDRPGIYAVATAGSGEPSRIDLAGLVARGATWSPAGDQVAFLEGDGRVWHVVVADPRGGSRRVVATDVAPTAPRWSPDGRLLAYIDLHTATDGAIRIVGADGDPSGVTIPLTGLSTSQSGAGAGALTWQRVAP